MNGHFYCKVYICCLPTLFNTKLNDSYDDLKY